MTQLPNQQGSGGGISNSGLGGAGGGYLKAEIETLTVDGKKYGPRREKTCLQGFRLNEIQTSLQSYIDQLEN